MTVRCECGATMEVPEREQFEAFMSIGGHNKHNGTTFICKREMFTPATTETKGNG